MKLPQDFKEFLELFNAKGVEYMIVGSYEIDAVPISVIGREDYIANKIASGRIKDLADVEALGGKIH
jgi:hypothetical protein